MLEGNVPEGYTQLPCEQNSLYLHTTGNAVHKADNGPELLKETPEREYA